MPGPIQTIPQGLLGILQLKQTGSNPSQLADTVIPYVDLFPMWVQRLATDIQQSTQAVNTATPTGSGAFTPSIIVPNGFAWFVTDYTVECPLGAAETIQGLCCTYISNVVAAPPAAGHILSNIVTDVVTARARRLKVTARNFWLGPGNQLGFAFNDDLTAATITLTGSVRGVVVPV